MPDKNDDFMPDPLRLPGRPPKNPDNVIRTPIRFLTTRRVESAVYRLCEKHGLNPSDLLRLALYRYFEAEGALDTTLRKDATWDTLREQGMI